MANRDFLDEMIEERTARNPDFPGLLEAAERRRSLLHALAEKREEGKRSQTEIAALMRSSQSSVARLEGAAADAKMSTVDRYAAAIGFRVQWHLIPADKADAKPPVVVHR